MKFTHEEFLSRLSLPADDKWKDGVRFIKAFSKENFELEFFAPRGTDNQTPHTKDEFYIIAAGSANLIKENEMINCKAGDALFVAAGAEHHFANISDNFATWVIFF